MTNREFYYPDFDLGEFRYTVARYCKLLIRARWKCDPGFLDEADLAAWGLEDIGTDRWSACQLLDQAAAALGHLNRHFLPRCGSGGVRETDESTPEGRLIWVIAGLVPTDGGGPAHNAALLEASRQLRDGKPLDWGALVEWDCLKEIRANLDQLPHPRREAALSRSSETLTVRDGQRNGDTLTAAMVETQGMQREIRDLLLSQRTVKEFYTIAEVAEILGRSKYSVREWCRKGQVQAVKAPNGRSWLVSHAELTRVRNHGPTPEHQSDGVLDRGRD
jgi:excisionase family DNA binding protein